MKYFPTEPPRPYTVGKSGITLREVAKLEMEDDEVVTFVTPEARQYDVTRKSWGFYATPSLNGRLKGFGLRGALITGEDGKFFVFLVEDDRIREFEEYLESEGLRLVLWLDDEDVLRALDKGSPHA